jgi:aspartate/methionine/tyrosine aminotransferase
MFAPTRYLDWARRFYGQVRFDLATSGIPLVPAAALATDAPGHEDGPSPEALRAAIAFHNDVSPGEVVPALGTTHAIWLAYAAVIAHGGERDEVLVEDPGYEPLVRIAEGAGARVARFTRDPGQRYALDPDRIARAMTPRTRAVVVTNLHNPTGVRTSDERLRDAARVAEEGGALLLVNEVYAELDRWVDGSGVFRGSARRLAPNVIAVSSLTKSYGLGPERIGWLLGPGEVVARANDAFTATISHFPRAYARVALQAFAKIAPLAARARESLSGKRERVAAWVAARGLSWSAPEDGLFGFVTMPGRGDLTATIEAAARDHEVLVGPGAFFGVPNGFRLAWSLPEAALDEGLARLARGLAC